MKTVYDILKEIAIKIKGPLPKRTLGKTGLEVTTFGLGGGALVSLEEKDSEEKAYELITKAIELGVNYFDTAPTYGPSEDRLGKILPPVRDDIILATKTQDRTYDGSMRLLEQSLKRLHTDRIDIWQLHHPDDMEEVEQISASDGAIHALQKAKDQGIVRYIGLTGHYDPEPLNTLIDRFDFDTILMTLNAADVHTASFKKMLLDKVLDKNMGIIGMKVTCLGRIFHPGALNSMKDALYYVLSLPVSTVIIGCDGPNQLYENILLTKDFSEPFDEKKMKELEDKTKSYSHLALFYRIGNEHYNPFWKAHPQKVRDHE